VITGLAKLTTGWSHGFRHAGGMADLGSLDPLGHSHSWGQDINTGGSIVGWADNLAAGSTEAVYWGPGATSPSSIHDPALFSITYAMGIADSEAVTGWAVTAGGAVNGFRWTRGGGMKDLGSPVGQCLPHDINSSDWIVATSGFLGTPVAYVRNPAGAGTWLNLNDRVPHGCGMIFDEARAINGAGQIAGFGTKTGSAEVRGYRLTPVASGLALGRLSPNIAGALNEISILGGTPGAKVYLVGGLTAGATAVPGCPGLSADIAGATHIATETVDASKRATFSFVVPLALFGRTSRMQAVERASCRKSNVVITVIG